MADAIEHAACRPATFGLLIEYFRGSPHEEVIAMVSGQIEENAGEEGEQEAVFIDTVERLRAQTLKQQIEDLNAKARQGVLSPAERQSLADLLARKRA